MQQKEGGVRALRSTLVRGRSRGLTHRLRHCCQKTSKDEVSAVCVWCRFPCVAAVKLLLDISTSRCDSTVVKSWWPFSPRKATEDPWASWSSSGRADSENPTQT